MALNNLLGIADERSLAVEEERLSKIRALELFDNNILNTLTPGSISALIGIHKYLFQDVYPFAGEIRRVDMSKGSFRFASHLYLESALKAIDVMPQDSFEKIVEKYVEINVAHPFREGNGRAGRIWLDHALNAELSLTIDWSLVDKQVYLLAMERSPVTDTEIKLLLKGALVPNTHSREMYMKGIDLSYSYEGYSLYSIQDLNKTTSSQAEES